jgi:hypothetical protein
VTILVSRIAQRFGLARSRRGRYNRLFVTPAKAFPPAKTRNRRPNDAFFPLIMTSNSRWAHSRTPMARRTTIEEIEAHLLSLRGGNHEDNMKVVRHFPRHYSLLLAEHDFMDLVFLQTKTLSKIAPAESDRRLRAVAQRASQLSPTESNLGRNWDIAASLERFRASYLSQSDCHLPDFVLRDPRGSERDWAPDGWYLQDGSHRALAYCITILTGEMQYSPQRAFCATSRHIDPCA